jgi:hypothetical protein
MSLKLVKGRACFKPSDIRALKKERDGIICRGFRQDRRVKMSDTVEKDFQYVNIWKID